ncbi:MAG: hypothetical protein JWN24_3991 [Phycisphaerales bacterium]|nr:hypothetical protein [Phycisphaerales bacterium]
MSSTSVVRYRPRARVQIPALCIASVIYLIGPGCAKDKSSPSAAPSAAGASAPAVEVRPAAPDVPAEIRVNGPTVLIVHAQGVQIYVCQPAPAGKLAWKLKAPDAAFTSDSGVKGKHYAGPTWECTTDGSKVTGRKAADHAAPVEDAVPWLLLEATSHDGNGALSQVTFIQRVNTIGGMAPPISDAKPGDEVRVPYSADYVFYGAGATTRSAVP